MAIRSYLEPIASFARADDYTVRFVLKRPYWFAFDAIAEVFIYPSTSTRAATSTPTLPTARRWARSVKFERW